MEQKKKHGGQQKSKFAHYMHPIFGTYRNMVRRCYNNKTRSHKNYEGKGITVNKEWLENKDTFFEWAMANGWKQGLTIDRIDSDGNYEPSNCQWLTKAENNARRMQKRRGELANQKLLSDDHVRAIRLLAKLRFSAYAIGGFLGVSSGTVYDILKKRTWAHIE